MGGAMFYFHGVPDDKFSGRGQLFAVGFGYGVVCGTSVVVRS